MEILENMTDSPLFWAILAQVVAGLWGLRRIQEIRQDVADGHYRAAWQAALEAVQETYFEVVRPWRVKNESRSLPDQVASQARALAMEKLRDKLRQRRAPALKALPDAMLWRVLEDAVAREKRKEEG